MSELFSKMASEKGTRQTVQKICTNLRSRSAEQRDILGLGIVSWKMAVEPRCMCESLEQVNDFRITVTLVCDCVCGDVLTDRSDTQLANQQTPDAVGVLRLLSTAVLTAVYGRRL